MRLRGIVVMDKITLKHRKRQVEELLQIKAFKDIILKEYMNDSIHELMFREGSSDGVCRGIDSRKSLNDFLFGIIEEGKILEER